MNESEWQQCSDLEAMAAFLEPHILSRPEGIPAGIVRKIQLFAIACCRRIAYLRPDALIPTALDVAERIADGGVISEEMQQAVADRYSRLMATGETVEVAIWWAMMEAVCVSNENYDRDGEQQAKRVVERAFTRAQIAADQAAIAVLTSTRSDSELEEEFHADDEETRIQCALLRDNVGNPFRAVTEDRSWLNVTFVNDARSIYTERAFDRMPTLADALVGAGCADEEILAHCRAPEPHARGCWVVDLILGK